MSVRPSKKGAVGIGTLIIFIAMVLVAAIAAAVLINVSGILQQKAMATGKQSIAQVSSNILVVSIRGNTNAAKTLIDNINATITAAAGADRLDMGQLVVVVGNNVNQSTLVYSTNPPSATTFNMTELRDPSNLFSPATPIIDSSALVLVNMNVTAANILLPPRSQFHLELVPETGASTVINTVTPNSYATPIVSLYP